MSVSYINWIFAHVQKKSLGEMWMVNISGQGEQMRDGVREVA